VFYPEATPERCTAALMLEVDPAGLVRRRQGPPRGRRRARAVWERPALCCVVVPQGVLGSALGGRSKDRPELAQQAIPLEARISVLTCRGGERFLRALFEPLGYEVAAVQHQLDEANPERGREPVRHGHAA